MYIILRLICEILSKIAVKISFLRGHKQGVYAQASLTASVTSWYLRNGLQNFTSFPFSINIICFARWLCDANFKILHCSGAFIRRHKIFKPENSFKQTRVDFLPRKDDVISQLRQSYANDPLWVTQLINYSA